MNIDWKFEFQSFVGDKTFPKLRIDLFDCQGKIWTLKIQVALS